MRRTETERSEGSFPEALRQLRAERGLSYRQLAYMTGLSAGYLSHLDKGSRGVPRNEVLEVIACALHVKPAYFMEYRMRCVVAALSASPGLVSSLYVSLCEAYSTNGQPRQMETRTAEGLGSNVLENAPAA